MSQTNRIVIQFVQNGAANVTTSLRRIGAAAKASANGVGFLQQSLLGLSAGFLAKKIFDEVDAYTNLQNRLTLVTRNQRELATVQQELFEVSQRTRTGIEVNASLFNRLATSTTDLKLSYRELFDITETLNKAIQIGGSTSLEASAGLIQLSQGLASGTLRADELRAVIEQLPGVADIIARKLDSNRAGLRTLGAQGKITSQIMISAFQEAREEIAVRFSKVLISPRSALTLLTNSLTNFFGKLSSSTGLTAGFGNAVLKVSKFLDILTYGLRGLIASIQANAEKAAIAGFAFRVLAAIFAVIITIKIASFFYMLAVAVVAPLAGVVSLVGALKALAILLTIITSFGLGTWLYSNFKIVQFVADSVITAFQAVWAALSAAAIDIKTIFTTVFDAIGDGFMAMVSLVSGEIEKLIKKIESVTNIPLASGLFTGLKTIFSNTQSPANSIIPGFAQEMAKNKERYDKELQLIVDVRDLNDAKRAANFSKGGANDAQSSWQAVLADAAAMGSSAIDSALIGGFDDLTAALKKWGDEAKAAGLITKEQLDLLMNTPDAVQGAAASMAEYEATQRKGARSLVMFTDSLKLELELLNKTSEERQAAKSQMEAEKLLIEAIYEANTDALQATVLYRDALAAIDALKQGQLEKAATDEMDEYRKSVNETTDALVTEVQALEDLTQESSRAQEILTFSADANKAFGQSSSKAAEALATFIALLDRRDAATKFRDDIKKATQEQEELQKSVDELVADLRLENQALSDLSQSSDDARKSLEFAAKANLLFGEGTDAAVLALAEFNALLEENTNLQRLRDDAKKAEDDKESAKTSIGSSLSDLKQQREALLTFSSSTDRARTSLEFAAKANLAFGATSDIAKEKIREFNDLLDQTEALETYRKIVEEISQNIAQSFEDVIFGAKSVEEAIEDMVKNVAKMIFNQLVTQQIAGFLTSFAGGPGTAGGKAIGLAGFLGFANGGVINSPTFLGLANGMPAIGGESGPEAIVPLPDGRQIPVAIRGGSNGVMGGQQNVTNINMKISTPDADSFRRSSRQISDDLRMQMRGRR
jgi:tape measure domain-containing protein